MVILKLIYYLLISNTWQAILKPVYIFPLLNTVDSTYSDYERRIYDDQIILTRNLNDIAVPERISFSRCYPNPFNTETTIEYYLPEPCRITIKIIDLQGKILRILDDGEKNSGISRTIWDGKDEDGNTVTSGLYFYRIETSTGLTEIKRMIFLK